MSKRDVPNVVFPGSIFSESRWRSELSPWGRNIKLEIEYDGTNYCGWQIQVRGKASKPSIQATIEKALQKILQEKVRLIVSGRTDAQVHALAQVANFQTNSLMGVDKLQRALNGNLPEDIVIVKIEEVSLDFHSRFTAKSKLYRYTILNLAHPSALLRSRVYHYPYPLDIRLMQAEAKVLLGRHDFKAFCASGSNAKDTVRTIKHISVREISYPLSAIRYPLLIIDIEADGFLYNMARNIVGTLIEIGRGGFPKGSLKKILLSRNRKLAGPTVPACGLCLLKVHY